MALYELTGEIKRLYQMAEEDEDFYAFQDAFKDTMEGLQGEFDDKVANIGRFVKSLEADAKAIGEESQRLSRKKGILEKRAKWLKGYLLKNLKEVGRTKGGDAVTTVHVKKNGGVTPLVFNEGVEVPDEYQKEVKEIDKDKIRKELESGKVLSFARLGERGESVTIK